MKTVQRNPDPIYAIARDEIKRWKPEMRSSATAVLFCFCHRLTTGKTFEETFCRDQPVEPDYQI